ncbi:hypothetical protein BYZ73_18275 [Rhodovulum viride]|uniref:Uncharacterized protein n=1 Tax=Rhodovulum viride TaxID=1231134 RepID=A0ABX9DBY1_9RHOB|nr:hypothetical protein [Rhodovulum viride]RAP39840.1 hypothetical protein BYZ73_18275 [Rhodovulum viride]
MLVLFTLASITGGTISALAGALLLDGGWVTVLLSYWLGGMVGGGTAVTVVALRAEPEDDAEPFVEIPPDDVRAENAARTRPERAMTVGRVEPVEADPDAAPHRIREGCDSH